VRIGFLKLIRGAVPAELPELIQRRDFKEVRRKRGTVIGADEFLEGRDDVLRKAKSLVADLATESIFENTPQLGAELE
jgi:hypothetical protein